MKRFMKKMNEKKGFTLAELLIVVAIIAVLVAVAIPVFTAQLDKARAATELANARSTYAEAVSQYLTDDTKTSLTKTYDGIAYAATTTDSGATWTVTLTTKKSTSGKDSYSFPEAAAAGGGANP